MTTTATPKKPRCEYISKIGARCHADPQVGRPFCFFHDPEKKKERAEARQQGGQARTRQLEVLPALPSDLPVLPLRKAADVIPLLSQTVDQLIAGAMDCHSARTIAYLASLLLRAFKQKATEVAEQLALVINQLRRGEIGLRSAKAVGQLSNLLLCSLKQDALDRRAAQDQDQNKDQADSPGKDQLNTALETLLTRIAPTSPLEAKQAQAEPTCEPAFA